MKQLLLILLLGIAIRGAAQEELLAARVSCRLDSQTLTQALETLSRENDLRISFSNTFLPEDRHYSYDFQEVALGTVIQVLLRDTDLTYTVARDYLIVRPCEPGEAAPPPPLFTISGFVEDSLSGERLVGANLYFPSLRRGANTNAEGFFSISLPAGSWQLDISYVGFHPRQYWLGLFSDLKLKVQLARAGVLQVVEVRAPAPGGGRAELLPAQPGRERMPAALLERMPGLLGENDALQALGWLPGVQVGTSNLGNFSVRNGDTGHNLILLDGAQIYSANHMLGLFSVFNGSAVKDIELIKGAMPARYGGRLSSVVAVNGREGDFHRWKGEGAAGLLLAKGLAEGPIIPGKMSLLVSGRRSYWDLLLRPILKSLQDGLRLGYYFGDLNVKVKHKISERDEWSLTAYLGEDRFRFREENDSVFANQDYPYRVKDKTEIDIAWRNKAVALKWNRIWTDRLFSSASLALSDYRFKLSDIRENRNYEGRPFLFEGVETRYRSGVRDLSLRADFEFNLRPRLSLHFGGSFIWHRFLPQASGDVFQTVTEAQEELVLAAGGREVSIEPLVLDALESGAYAEFRGRWRRLHWQLGLHLAAFYHDVLFVSPQPRLQFNFQLGNRHELIAAFRLNEQYAHLLSNNAINLPTDLWAPATQAVRPQRSWQASVGWQKYWDKDLSFRAEGYYHDMRRLTTFTLARSFFSGSDWEDRMIQGNGNSYGFEFSARKMLGRLQGIASYDLSWSWRRYPGLNQNERFPARQNRRHQFSLLMQYRVSPKVRFSAGWVYYSGNFLTIADQYSPAVYPVPTFPDGAWLSDLNATGRINNYQAPDYHRLDVNFDFLKKGRGYVRKWTFGVFNAYNHRNPSIIYADTFFDRREITAVSIFMLIPSISYQLKF